MQNKRGEERPLIPKVKYSINGSDLLKQQREIIKCSMPDIALQTAGFRTLK